MSPPPSPPSFPGAVGLPPEDPHGGTRWLRVQDTDGSVSTIEGPRREG